MILDGKKVAKTIEDRIKHDLDSINERKPALAFILVGDNPASISYIRMKKKKCAEVGILSKDREFSSQVSEKELLDTIQSLNADPTIDGILVQLPLPNHISTHTILEAVDPSKDVDGFHPMNIGKLIIGDNSGFIPCTPYGIMVLLKHAQIDPKGKHVVILGRSAIVGKPLAALLMQKKEGANATVTVVHSASQQVKEITKTADILIAAMGKPKFVTADMVKEGATIIDVGITRTKEGLLGDVDFASVSQRSQHITPVPGGVGPMTIAMLLSNTLSSYQKTRKRKL